MENLLKNVGQSLNSVGKGIEAAQARDDMLLKLFKDVDCDILNFPERRRLEREFSPVLRNEFNWFYPFQQPFIPLATDISDKGFFNENIKVEERMECEDPLDCFCGEYGNEILWVKGHFMSQ